MAITSQQRLLLEQKLDQTSDVRKWNYLCVILAFEDGFDPKTIASVLHLSQKQVMRFIKHSKRKTVFKLLFYPLKKKKDRLG